MDIWMEYTSFEVNFGSRDWVLVVQEDFYMENTVRVGSPLWTLDKCLPQEKISLIEY